MSFRQWDCEIFSVNQTLYDKYKNKRALSKEMVDAFVDKNIKGRH